jgi:hypothetical protein
LKATPPSKKRIGASSDNADTTTTKRDEYESLMLQARVIDATNDITPSANALDPFLYWHSKKSDACALKLLARYPDLTKYADKHYFGVHDMARKWNGVVGRKATNERATQIQYIKALWLSSSSQFHLALHVLLSEQPRNAGGTATVPIKVSPDLVQSGIETVDELRGLIKSDKMYTNEVLYDCFCSGLESGALKQLEKRPPTHIKKLITIAHEAHFRTELWFSLSSPGYGHRPNKTWNFTRKTEWKTFIHLVHADREANADNAHRSRMQTLNENDNHSGHEDSDNEGLDPKYFRN